MEPNLQRRVQRYGWDKAAAYYERYWSHQLKPAQQLMLSLAALRPGERVLDVACGTGLVSFPAAEAVGPTGAVVGTDISDAMVQTLRTRAASRNFTNLSAERMDAERLTLPDGTFDVVLCALGLMYVPEPLTSVSEMLRVLKPGGRMAVAIWGARFECGWAEIFPIVDRRVESEVCPLFFQLGTGDSLRFALQTAGAAEVVTQRLTTTLRYDSAEDALAAAFAGGPVALAYSRFPPVVREAAHREYLASIEPYRDAAGGYEIPGAFVAAAACRPG